MKRGLHLAVFIMISSCLRKRRCEQVKNVHMILNQQNCHPLPLLTADIPPKLANHLKWVLVPPTKSVHNRRNEDKHRSLYFVLVRFYVEGMLDLLPWQPVKYSNRLHNELVSTEGTVIIVVSRSLNVEIYWKWLSHRLHERVKQFQPRILFF